MSRRSPPALPPQPEDPVPVEHDISDGDGGSWMVDKWTASQFFSSLSPPRLPLPCSGWESVFVHLPSSPLRSPTGISPLWEFDDEQRPPLQMGPTANCSAAVLEAAPRDTSHFIRNSSIRAGKGMVRVYLVLVTGSTCLTEAAEELDAVKRDVEKTFLSRGLVHIHMSCGLEIQTNTETGGYDDGNVLSDNDAEQTEISMKPPRNSFLVWLHFTKETEQQAAAIRDLRERGLEIHMNTKTGGSSLAMIESCDDDELGDNDAKQTKFSKKRPRNSSLAWLHFTKVHSKDSGMMTATCKYCNKALKSESTHGTSHLLRHLKNVHLKDLSSSEARKEPQWSSCSQKLQITGSAPCAGIPTPLSENKGNKIELQDKHFEQGETSGKPLKRTSRTQSDVWLHFTKLPSDDPSGVRAECNYCKKTLKANSQNGTSHLWRHLKKVHVEKTKSNYPD